MNEERTESPQNPDSLVDAIYEAAEDPTKWTAFLSALCAATGSENAALVVHDLRSAGTSIRWCHFDIQELERYRTTYAALNPWTPLPGHQSPVGEIVRSESRLSLSKLRQTRFYREWGLKNNVVHSIAINLGIQDDYCTYLTISSGESNGPISAAAEAILSGISRHLARAVRFERQLSHAYTLTEAIDRIAGEVFFTGADGRLIEATPKGRKLLDQGTLVCVDPQGVLQGVTRELSALVERKGAGNEHSLQVVDLGKGVRAASVLVKKQVPGALGSQNQRMVVILRSDIAGSISALASIFSLTLAETRLAAAVAETGRLTKAASQLKISQNTAKTQMASIFEKTATRSQGEMIRVFASLTTLARLSAEALC